MAAFFFPSSESDSSLKNENLFVFWATRPEDDFSAMFGKVDCSLGECFIGIFLAVEFAAWETLFSKRTGGPFFLFLYAIPPTVARAAEIIKPTQQRMPATIAKIAKTPKVAPTAAPALLPLSPVSVVNCVGSCGVSSTGFGSGVGSGVGSGSGVGFGSVVVSVFVSASS